SSLVYHVAARTLAADVATGVWLPGGRRSRGCDGRVLGQTVPPAPDHRGRGEHHLLTPERGSGSGHGGAGRPRLFFRGDQTGRGLQSFQR
ncbi:hypothetical protein M9458_035793, partial [Cirrhinus mrigala]